MARTAATGSSARLIGRPITSTLAPPLRASRGVLNEYGNMSSATVLFVLQRLMADRPATGLALAFGPGLALEGLRFGWIEGDAG